ncbi:MAG: signal peptidase II [Chloroflexi bacterium]|nr:signal peptidase II [Chloroflexota bacterium]MBT5628193.1 signal peptidase II [Chloroflexota bacterium]
MTSELPNSTTREKRSKLTDPLPWIMMLLALGLDQLTKWLTIENLAVGESWPAEGFFRFTHAWNTGTAFSLFQGQGDILTWVSLAAVVVLTFIYRSIDDPPWVLRVAFGMQFGGAIGNIIDRIRLGHVTDFLDVGWWPIFNIADSSIVIGIALMVFYFWFLDEGQKTDAKDEEDVSTVESNDIAEPATATTSVDSPE